MNEKLPKVSIGLAVFNGENYLEQAINSILSQTFRDFELIISDNASTDRTKEICLKYSKQDPRIRYHRNAVNIGGANNENLTFKMARGEYFRWAAHDDYCAPTLIEKCLEQLERDPTVVLCHSKVIAVDGCGETLGPLESNEGTASHPFVRFCQLSNNRHKCEATYGLVRSSMMANTQLQKNYTGSDRAFLCELAMLGRFVQLPDYLFYKRFHAKNKFIERRGRMAWFDPKIASEGRITFPTWMGFANYLRIIHEAPIHWIEKFLCYLWMCGPWVMVNGKRLTKDILAAIHMAFHNREWRRHLYESTNNWS